MSKRSSASLSKVRSLSYLRQRGEHGIGKISQGCSVPQQEGYYTVNLEIWI
jgi:hypothetical protein